MQTLSRRELRIDERGKGASEKEVKRTIKREREREKERRRGREKKCVLLCKRIFFTSHILFSSLFSFRRSSLSALSTFSQSFALFTLLNIPFHANTQRRQR